VTAFESHAHDLRMGVIDFDEFARRTQEYWRAQAFRVLARWTHPADVEPADLVQQMLLEAWIRVGKYDPAKYSIEDTPRAFARHMVWNAIDKAKKWLHRTRGVRTGTQRSRHARPLSSYEVRSSDGDTYMPGIFEECMAHDPTDRTEQCIDLLVIADRAIHAAPTEAQSAALAALKLTRFDHASAAEKLYRDSYCRLSFNLESRAHAERLIERAVAAL
jgi:hypothetical protein